MREMNGKLCKGLMRNDRRVMNRMVKIERNSGIRKINFPIKLHKKKIII
jgi:hypothetical protein